MEVILIEGVEYIKANVAAKRFKYTSDYIGQLCRGKKIDAKLVGRTWYVNPLSITTHKKEKLIKNAVNSELKKALHVKADKTVTTIDIEPVPRGVTAKILPKNNHQSHFAKHIDWKPIKYEEDKADLLPNLGLVNEKSTRLMVDMAGAEKVTVKETFKGARMFAESLPEVSLIGTLKVHSLDERFTDEDENIAKNIDIPEEFTNKTMIKSQPTSLDQAEKVVIQKISKTTPQANLRTKDTAEINEKDALYNVEIHKVNPFVSFAPKMITEKAKSKQKPVKIEEKDEAVSLLKILIILILLGGLFLGVVYCLELDIFTTSSEYNWGIIFNFPHLKF